MHRNVVKQVGSGFLAGFMASDLARCCVSQVRFGICLDSLSVGNTFRAVTRSRMP